MPTTPTAPDRCPRVRPHSHGWAGWAGWALALLVTVAACGPGEATVAPAPTDAPSCPGAEALDARWTPARRDALAEGLAELGAEWSEQTLANLDARVDGRGPSWRQTYAEACAADDLRAQRCLDAQLWRFDALVELSAAEPARAAQLWSALDEVLREPERCAGTPDPTDPTDPTDSRFDLPPLEPEQGRTLASLGLLVDLDLSLDPSALVDARAALDSLARVEAVTSTPARALVLATSAAQLAAASDDPSAALAALEEATGLAATLGPEAALTLARARARVLLAGPQPDAAAARAALDQAVDLARSLDDPWLSFRALRERGVALLELGEPETARASLAEAVALSTRLAGPENPHTADVQLALARAELALAKIEGAHDLLNQARDSFINTLGPDHPQTLATVEAIAGVFLAAGQPGDAINALLDLLEIYTVIYGGKDVRTAKVKLELGDALFAMDQHDGARTLYLEALNPLVQTLGADHRDVIRTSIHLGMAQLELADLDEAARHCERGLDLVKALAADDVLADEAKDCVARLARARKKAKRRR